MNRTPGATSQTGQRPANGQIEPSNKGGLDAAGEALRCERLAEGIRLTEQDVAADVGDAVPAVTLDDLGIQPARVDTPGAAAFIGGLHPGPEMGRECIDVERQAIAGENRPAVRGQALGDIMDQLMREGLGARAGCKKPWGSPSAMLAGRSNSHAPANAMRPKRLCRKSPLSGGTELTVRFGRPATAPPSWKMEWTW